MTLLIALILAPFTLLTICFAIEVFVGLVPLPRRIFAESDGSAVIVVPAHDEELGLRLTLRHLKGELGAHVRILVVADNCVDSTAQVAKEQGVELIERLDAVRKGKGFALDFARSHLMNDPPQVVVIVDADCTMDARSLMNLIGACEASERPCQAINLQKPNYEASPAVQLSTFAFFIKNVVRQRALQRLARRVNLLGTGMAFPWPIFAEASLATNSIVEDLKLGQELALAGHAPLLVEDANVWSKAETKRNTLSQRRRWEGGFLQTAMRVGPPMFWRSLIRIDAPGVWAGIHLMIPPFALLILLDVVGLILATGSSLVTGTALWPVLVLAVGLIFAFVALACAWCAGGSRFVSLAALTRAPFYVLWKLPMYIAFARAGMPQEWQRTERE
ncbi:MAG TPA: glycosyltransferase family 2 protein [Sphingomicrobium sp.]|nr:glycosyltransferase family 2 protein [Sphingomicrobium sp.]